MIALFTTISNLLGLKLVQWVLLSAFTVLLCSFIVYGFKYNTLKLEHAFLQVEATKQAEAIKVQNVAIKELGDKSKIYLDNYNNSVKKTQQIFEQTSKDLKRIGEYQFEGDCSQSVKETFDLVKKGVL